MFLLYLLLLLFGQLEAQDYLTIQDYFGDMPYSVTLFNIDNYMQQACTNNVLRDATTMKIPGLTWHNKIIHETSHSVAPLLTRTKDTPQIRRLGDRIQNCFDQINKAKADYSLEIIQTNYQRQKQRNISLPTPRLLHKNFPAEPRHNVYDMLSLKIDRYILDFGIWQEIFHLRFKDTPRQYLEKQQEISMLAAVVFQDGYHMLGVMQYTFDSSNICYHRAFKPCDPWHMRQLSASLTQQKLKDIVKLILQDAKSHNPTTIAAERLKIFLESCPRTMQDLFYESFSIAY